MLRRDKARFLIFLESIVDTIVPSTFLNQNKRGYCKLYSPHGFEQRLHVGIIYLQLQLGTALFLNCGKKKKDAQKVG